MKLSEWIDRTKLDEYITGGLVTSRKHPTLPLRILNYTPAAQGEKNWDKTLRRCRGLVYEENTEDIYAIPFEKFWNYNDAGHPETLPEHLPPGNPAIYDKIDGSLGIGFIYKDRFIIATRGSFESDQAKWAQHWIDERIGSIKEIDAIFTYLFEIVVPWDRKVVNYDFSGLVLLGEVDFKGRNYRPDTCVLGFLKDVRFAKQNFYEPLFMKIESWTEDKTARLLLDKLQTKDTENEEGFVAVWFKGSDTLRVKIKFETYKRLHRLYFQTTTDVIWELVKSGQLKEESSVHNLFEGADPALKEWVMRRAMFIALDYVEVERVSKRDFRFAVDYTNSLYDLTASEKDRRKAFAFIATSRKHPQLLFLLYDAKVEEYNDAVWKIVKPVPNERFTDVEDDA